MRLKEIKGSTQRLTAEMLTDLEIQGLGGFGARVFKGSGIALLAEQIRGAARNLGFRRPAGSMGHHSVA